MSESELDKRRPLASFGLLFVVSVPFYFFSRVSLLPSKIAVLPAVTLMAWLPLVIALSFTARESGPRAALSLLGRAFDIGRVKLPWFAAILFLLPTAMLIAYSLARLVGDVVPAPLPIWHAGILQTLGLFLFLYAFAVGEEIGWTAYATDPLQARWGTLPASIAIGAVWAAWHVVPWYLLHPSIGWVAAMAVGTLLQRVLIVWLYNNTGSVFAAAAFHATYNVAYQALWSGSTRFDPLPMALVLLLITGLIIAFWGPSLVRSKASLEPV